MIYSYLHWFAHIHTGHVSPAYRDSHLKPLVDLFCLSEACLVAGTTMFVCICFKFEEAL